MYQIVGRGMAALPAEGAHAAGLEAVIKVVVMSDSGNEQASLTTGGVICQVVGVILPAFL